MSCQTYFILYQNKVKAIEKLAPNTRIHHPLLPNNTGCYVITAVPATGTSVITLNNNRN